MQQELFQEIDRVVNSSYPTQLQTLANILVRADDLDIETWSLSRPHQIQPLIEDVLAALPVWSYCLDIISRLATVRSTRDALLSIEPALLPGIVDKAIEHFDTDGRYLPEAVALLRYNLPDETPVPASVQILLVKVSAKAASKLDSRSVGLLDVLLSGSCKALTRSFSSDGLRRLEENVFKILRDASDVEQQFLALVCLSIMKNLLSSSTSAAMRAFFDAQKAHKTLQLVVLQVIWSCTAQGDHRKVATAINVVEGVPETVRWQWSEKNASVIRKLIEKLGQGDLPSSLRLQVLTFLILLIPTSQLPPATISAYQELLDGVGSIKMPVNDLEMALSRSIPVMKSRLNARSVTAILENAAKNCQTSPTDHGSIARSGALLSAMNTAGANFSPDQVHGLWPLSPSLHAVVKRRSHNSLVIGLLQSLSTLLIQSAVVAAQAGVTIPTSSIADLLSVSLVPQSTANGRRLHNPSALFSRRSTGLVSSHAGWRETLSKAIEVKSATEHETILAAVTSICADLEQRCHDFEAPLRAEKTKFSKLQCEYNELTDAFGKVESQLVDRDVQVSNMEAERLALHADLNNAVKEKTNLLLRIDEAEARLQEAQLNAREEVARLQQKCEESEVHHASEKARQQEEIEMLTGRGKQLARDGQGQTEQLRHEKTHRAELENKILSIEAARSALAEQVESTTEALKLLRNDMSSAQDQQKELRDRLTSESNELKGSRAAVERLRSEMLELKDSTEQEKQDFIAEYHASANQARAEWQAQRVSMQNAITSLEGQAEEVAKSNSSAVHAMEARLHDQQRKIEKLKKECGRKDDQISEAQEMRNRLMSAMGLAGTIRPLGNPPSTLPIRSLSSVGTPAPHQVKTPGRSQMDGADEMDLLFDSSVWSHQEPTPKRTKPRKAFKVPTLAAPLASSSQDDATGQIRPVSAPDQQARKPSRSARFSRTIDRQPLAETTANLLPQNPSPAKVTFKDVDDTRAPMTEADLQILEGWSFSGSDVVAGTPGEALARTMEGETTVDE